MKQALSDQKQTLNGKAPIVFLSVLSFVCIVLGFITSTVLGFIVHCYCGFEVLISAIVSLPSICLFMSYVLKLHNKGKTTVLFLIIGLTAVGGIITSLLFWVVFIAGPIIPACVLATVSVLTGFNKKHHLVIAFMLATASELVPTCVYIIRYYDSYNPALFLFTTLICTLGSLGSIAFYGALLWFGLKNRIPPILKEKANPETELKLLNKKLELGIITREEYQAQRAEIIRKL